MNKKRIILLSVAGVALVVCLALAVTLIILNTGGHRHRFGDWEIDNQPTCTAYGSEHRTCKSCDFSEERSITRLGHDFSEQNVCKRCHYEVVATEGLGYTLSGESYTVDAGVLSRDVTEVVIPRYYEGKPVDAIRTEGFEERSFTTVYIPDGLKEIGLRAFYGCRELTSCTMSITTTRIDNLAFSDCPKLKELEIAPNVTFGTDVFRDCVGLESITIPDTVTEVGRSLFSGCTSLTTVSIGSGIKTIKNGMFENCSALTTFVLKEGITAIEPNAFKDCTSLRELVVPKSMKEFGATCLQSCTALTKITYAGTKSEWKAILPKPDSDWLANLDGKKDFIVYCTDGTLNRWGNDVVV